MEYIGNHNINPKRKLELCEITNNKLREISSHTYEEFDDLHILAISEMTKVHNVFHMSALAKDIQQDFNESYYTILKSMHDVTRKNLYYHIMSMYEQEHWDSLKLLIDNLEDAKSERAFLEIVMYGKMKTGNIADDTMKKTTINCYRKTYAHIEELFLRAECQWKINEEFSHRLDDIYTKYDSVSCKQEYFKLKTYIDFEKSQLELLLPFLMEFCVNPQHRQVVQMKSVEAANTPITPPIKPPITPPTKPKEAKCVEVVRKKKERASMYGHTCNHCNDFYSSLYPDDDDKVGKFVQECSKHRTKYKSNPETPEGYWDIDLHTPEQWKLEDEERARLKETQVTTSDSTMKKRKTTHNTSTTTTTTPATTITTTKQSPIVEELSEDEHADMMEPNFKTLEGGWIQRL